MRRVWTFLKPRGVITQCFSGCKRTFLTRRNRGPWITSAFTKTCPPTGTLPPGGSLSPRTARLSLKWCVNLHALLLLAPFHPYLLAQSNCCYSCHSCKRPSGLPNAEFRCRQRPYLESYIVPPYFAIEHEYLIILSGACALVAFVVRVVRALAPATCSRPAPRPLCGRRVCS